ncbi:Neurotrimin [Lamellibrachia satsuma]|nr:Neurotrimin [Lamellibrachia satsuma]
MAFVAVMLLMSITCTVYAQDPIVKITETVPPIVDNWVNAMQTDDVTFSCQVEQLPVDLKVKWKRDYFNDKHVKQTEAISTDTSLMDNTRYGIEKPFPFVWRLRLRRVKASDEANYTCQVMVTLQTFVTKTVNLKVNVKPYLLPDSTSSDMTVTEGEAITLRCNGTGLPAPVIEWTRLGNALLPVGTERYQGVELKLVNVKASDGGIYKCRVWNTVGAVIRSIDLKVRFQPVIEATEEVSQKLGYLIELQCFSKAYPYPTKTTWTKGSVVISTSSGRFKVHAVQGAFGQLTYELIINGVTQEDYGTYTCKIKNSQGQTTKEVKLIESDVPQKSFKVGKVVKGRASRSAIYLVTLVTCLQVYLVTQL